MTEYQPQAGAMFLGMRGVTERLTRSLADKILRVPAKDDRLVEANRIRKSIGAKTSFAQDLRDVGQMLQELEQIAQIVEQRLEQHETRGRTLTLKVKFSD
ncbi:hypothetical protein [Nostoc sp. UIC 10630]|uniref:DinB/UmuC family translesion DNA polymerase n=1 Tax=Nostoc sp. UIC 10630 TaxID=2100146 RepID=UPI0023DDB298|nr:hypothetical protein [Nostoc sp. UIC 10630]